MHQVIPEKEKDPKNKQATGRACLKGMGKPLLAPTAFKTLGHHLWHIVLEENCSTAFYQNLLTTNHTGSEQNNSQDSDHSSCTLQW